MILNKNGKKRGKSPHFKEKEVVMHYKKETNGELPYKLLRESLFWLAVGVFIFVPIINSLVIQTVILSIEGNIAYKGAYPVLNIAADILSVVSAYAGVGLMTVALAYFGLKKAKGVVILSITSHLVTFIASVLCYAFLGGVDYEKAIFFLGADMLAGIVVYSLIIMTVSLIRRGKKKRGLDTHPDVNGKIIGKGGIFSYIFASVGIYFGVQLGLKMYDMISAFLDPSIGLPINPREWMYWITEYLTQMIYGAIGYFTCLALWSLCKYYIRHFKKAIQAKDAQVART